MLHGYSCRAGARMKYNLRSKLIKTGSISLCCLLHKFIHLVIIKYTASLCTTLATAYTISYRICSDLEYLVIYSLFLKLLAYLVKCTVCIALRLRTSIQH